MNPIFLLVEYRLNNFMVGFDFKDLHAFTYNPKCEEMKEKLISYGYTIDTHPYDLNFCLYAIKHMIWKNIINYEIVENKMRTHMLYNNYISEYRITIYPINYDALLNMYDGGTSLDNTIINYFLLLTGIVMSNLISDLLWITKQYVFDVMLII